MALEKFPGFQPPITQLFRLANGTFEPHAFRHECEKFATFEAGSSDDNVWRFSLQGGPTLMVVLNTELTGRKKPNGWPEHRLLSVSCAILSLCWWDTFEKSEHANLHSWQKEREEFDQCYSELLTSTIEVLGLPRIQGSDVDEKRHRYAIWRGATGLLILQQSAYDPQFGLDVNYWVQPWSGPDPRPTSPFINWLCKLSSSS
jgi:hypothetical protein